MSELFYIAWFILSVLAIDLGIYTEKHYQRSNKLPITERLKVVVLSIVPFIMFTLVAMYWISMRNISKH